jgi:hypothetical protein
VLPLLLSLTGVPPRLGDRPLPFSGLDLSPTLQGRRLPRELVYADRQGDDREGHAHRTRMLRSATRKLVHNEEGQSLELWSVDGRAPEGEDLSASEHATKSALVEAYKALLESLRVPGSTSAHGDLDSKTQELLDSLGYTGRQKVTTGSEPGAPGTRARGERRATIVLWVLALTLPVGALSAAWLFPSRSQLRPCRCCSTRR